MKEKGKKNPSSRGPQYFSDGRGTFCEEDVRLQDTRIDLKLSRREIYDRDVPSRQFSDGEIIALFNNVLYPSLEELWKKERFLS